MTPANRKARDAANLLQGTCKSIHDLGEEFEALQDDQAFCDTLDSLVFCCKQCDWWHDISEIALTTANGFVCEDCDRENNNEDGDWE